MKCLRGSRKFFYPLPCSYLFFSSIAPPKSRHVSFKWIPGGASPSDHLHPPSPLPLSPIIFAQMRRSLEGQSQLIQMNAQGLDREWETWWDQCIVKSPCGSIRSGFNICRNQNKTIDWIQIHTEKGNVTGPGGRSSLQTLQGNTRWRDMGKDRNHGKVRLFCKQFIGSL